MGSFGPFGEAGGDNWVDDGGTLSGKDKILIFKPLILYIHII